MNRQMTVDEIVASIKRSCLPTMIVEGVGDLQVYRWLETKLSDTDVSIIVAGGRISLFDIYARRAEFTNTPVVFLADSDTYVYCKIPDEYSEIIFTKGYCIENELFRGIDLNHYLSTPEKENYFNILDLIAKWTAFEVQSYITELAKNKIPSTNFGAHIDQVCPKNSLCPDFLAKINFSEPHETVFNKIRAEYGFFIRGKQLFQMLSRILNSGVRLSDKQIIEAALRHNATNEFDNIINEIREQITA